MGLAVELDVRYIDQSVGDESVFFDPDASTIQDIPIDSVIYSQTPGRTLDELLETRKLGQVTLIPVLANAVLRFGVQRKTYAENTEPSFTIQRIEIQPKSNSLQDFPYVPVR